MSSSQMEASNFATDSQSGQARSSGNGWVRQAHRWLAIIFTLTVIANFVVRIWGPSPAWITYSPLPPLFLQMFSGLYLFALPYLAKRRA